MSMGNNTDALMDQMMNQEALKQRADRGLGQAKVEAIHFKSHNDFLQGTFINSFKSFLRATEQNEKHHKLDKLIKITSYSEFLGDEKLSKYNDGKYNFNLKKYIANFIKNHKDENEETRISKLDDLKKELENNRESYRKYVMAEIKQCFPDENSHQYKKAVKTLDKRMQLCKEETDILLGELKEHTVLEDFEGSHKGVRARGKKSGLMSLIDGLTGFESKSYIGVAKSADGKFLGITIKKADYLFGTPKEGVYEAWVKVACNYNKDPNHFFKVKHPDTKVELLVIEKILRRGRKVNLMSNHLKRSQWDELIGKINKYGWHNNVRVPKQHEALLRKDKRVGQVTSNKQDGVNINVNNNSNPVTNVRVKKGQVNTPGETLVDLEKSDEKQESDSNKKYTI